MFRNHYRLGIVLILGGLFLGKSNADYPASSDTELYRAGNKRHITAVTKPTQSTLPVMTQLQLNIAHTTNKLIWQGISTPCHCAAILRMIGHFGLCGNYTWSTFPIVSAASFCAAVVTWA